MKELRVLCNVASINHCNVGDILEVDGEIAVVTAISKKYIYIDGNPHNRKQVNAMKREFIYQYRRGKSMFG